MTVRWALGTGLSAPLATGPAWAAEAQSPVLVVLVDPGSTSLDPAQVKAAIARELRVAVADAPAGDGAGTMNVKVKGTTELTVTFQSADGQVDVTRQVGLPPDPAEQTETIALLAGNLARNEAGELLAALKPTEAPRETAEPAPERDVPRPEVARKKTGPPVTLELGAGAEASDVVGTAFFGPAWALGLRVGSVVSVGFSGFWSPGHAGKSSDNACSHTWNNSVWRVSLDIRLHANGTRWVDPWLGGELGALLASVDLAEECPSGTAGAATTHTEQTSLAPTVAALLGLSLWAARWVSFDAGFRAGYQSFGASGLEGLPHGASPWLAAALGATVYADL